MNVTCANGAFCWGQENYQEQCDVFFGPLCKYPCDLSQCQQTVELDTMCLEYVCVPAPPNKEHSYLALEICLPIIGILILLLCLLVIRYKRTPILGI